MTTKQTPAVHLVSFVVFGLGCLAIVAGVGNLVLQGLDADPMSTGPASEAMPLRPMVNLGLGAVLVALGLAFARLRSWARTGVEVWAWAAIVFAVGRELYRLGLAFRTTETLAQLGAGHWIGLALSIGVPAALLLTVRSAAIRTTFTAAAPAPPHGA